MLQAFACLQALGHQALAEAAGFFEGFPLGFDLAFQHVQGAADDDDEHGVGHHHRVRGIQPAGVFFPLLQGMPGGLMHGVVSEGA